MDREQAKDFVKGKLEEYLKDKGIDTRKPFRCLNPKHEDKHPSMSFDHKRKKARCFSCRVDYDTFDIIGFDYGLTEPKDIFNKAYEFYGLNVDQQNPPNSPPNQSKNVLPNKPPADDPKTEEKPKEPAKETIEDKNKRESEERAKKAKREERERYILKCSKRINETDYFKKRGLSEQTITRFSLGYDPNNPLIGGPGLIIPTHEGSYLVRNIDNTSDKRFRSEGDKQIFNQGALWSGNPVFIVEGEIDAMSVIETGAEAISLGSVAMVNKLIDILKEKQPSNILIISLDNDKAGKDARDKLKEELKKLSISFLTRNISGVYNDPNENLIKRKKFFTEGIHDILEIATEEEVKKERHQDKFGEQSVKRSLEYFYTMNERMKTPAIPTGFVKLDKVLEDGLYEGLYIVGALSSLGKTTFVLQIADQIAKNNKNDVLIFSLEMARTELMAKSISRLTFNLAKDRRDAKTNRGITAEHRHAGYSQEETDLIRKSTDAYGDYSDPIYIWEGIGDIGVKQIQDHVKEYMKTGRHPVVIIDYLQLLAPYEEKYIRCSDKQNMDRNLMELKILSRDSKIPVITVSSFNRSSYKTGATMEAFKESGSIEYSSDVLLGLQCKGQGGKDFDVDEAKKNDPRQMEIKILKNRNGATGDIINYEYYPLFNLFDEVIG